LRFIEVSPLPAPMVQHARALIGQWQGQPVQLLQWYKLNMQEHLQVARVWFRPVETEAAALATVSDDEADAAARQVPYVIVKYVGPAHYAHKEQHHINFAEELFHYQFLMQHRQAFDLFPALLGQRTGMFLLQDLGVDVYQYPNMQAIMQGVASTFVHLHTAFSGLHGAYVSARKAAGLCAPEQDLRNYGVPGNWHHARRGLAVLQEYAHIMGVCPPTDFEKLLAPIYEAIKHPGPFFTFVHDDLGDRRQSVSLEGQVYLLDLEHAKYFHGLMDLAKVLIGKVEFDEEKQAMKYNHARMPRELMQVYEGLWQAASGKECTQDFWQEHWLAVLVFQVGLAIDRLIDVSQDPMKHTVAQNMRLILDHFLYHTEHNPTHPVLMQVLRTLASRIMV